MGHDADDGLPGGHFLRAHFAFDILQGNETCGAAQDEFGDRDFELAEFRRCAPFARSRCFPVG